MKPTLMIHEVQDFYLDLPLEDYILTFDDGLYSQFQYWNHFKKLKTEKIFMTVEQIKELQSDTNTIVGGHSHNHIRLNSFSKLFERVEYIKQDTEQMIQWFDKNLEQFPSHFCFPYNEDLDGIYSGLLKKRGITHLYSNERIPIERLLHNDIPLDSPYILQV